MADQATQKRQFLATQASWKNTPYPEVPSSVFQRLF
jgi:hypothetical protein